MPIDKDALYGRFLASCERRERLADQATRKALDLPLHDDVNITTTHQGFSPGQLVALGAMLLASGGLGGGLAAWLLSARAPAAAIAPAQPSTNQSSTAQPSTAQPASSADAHRPSPPETQEFRVTFFGEDGKPIEVQRQPPPPADRGP